MDYYFFLQNRSLEEHARHLKEILKHSNDNSKEEDINDSSEYVIGYVVFTLFPNWEDIWKKMKLPKSLTLASGVNIYNPGSLQWHCHASLLSRQDETDVYLSARDSYEVAVTSHLLHLYSARYRREQKNGLAPDLTRNRPEWILPHKFRNYAFIIRRFFRYGIHRVPIGSNDRTIALQFLELLEYLELDLRLVRVMIVEPRLKYHGPE